MSVLASTPVSVGLPATDMARAKAFYGQTLGLSTVFDHPDSAMYACGEGTSLFVYPSAYAGTNKATAAGWQVADIEAAMAELRDRGVTFEDYDLPGLTTVDGVATIDGTRSAWFVDTEGNILAITQPA